MSALYKGAVIKPYTTALTAESGALEIKEAQKGVPAIMLIHREFMRIDAMISVITTNVTIIQGFNVRFPAAFFARPGISPTTMADKVKPGK